MKTELINIVMDKVGSFDAGALIKKLESFGIDNFESVFGGIKIPLKSIKNFDEFKTGFKGISQIGRLFEVSVINKDYVLIDTTTSCLSFLFDCKVQSYFRGVSPGNQILPECIKSDMKVLDVGAGDGLNAVRMRDKFKCDVYALEPNYDRDGNFTECQERYRDGNFTECQERLGKDKVDSLTLQDAIEQKSDKYSGAFDIVTVFKYNVSVEEKDSFIAALAKTLKPNGQLHITSVEKERLYFTEGCQGCYLLDTLKSHFDKVSIQDRESDGLIVCSEPIKLTNTLSFKK